MNGAHQNSMSRQPIERRQQELETVSEAETAASVVSDRSANECFEEDLDQNPELHFLSPVQIYEFEDWDNDSDDGEEVEWDAGITDFALFDSERRAAQSSKQSLARKWHDMLAGQASALERAATRTQSDRQVEPTLSSQSLSDLTMPALTPDHSPSLRDDLEFDSSQGRITRQTPVPNYLTVIVTPPTYTQPSGSAIVEEDEDDDDLPLSFYVNRDKSQRRGSFPSRQPPMPASQRPGLRSSRTMSGKPHVWRRPSWEIYPVREDVAAERRAEAGSEVEG